MNHHYFVYALLIVLSSLSPRTAFAQISSTNPARPLDTRLSQMAPEGEPDLAVWAPDQVRNCASVDYLEMQQQKDPNLQFRMQAIERFTQGRNRNQGRAVSGVITIPVVVHVLYNTSAENISDAQILSQMTILNDDFRRLNSDADNVWPQAADTEFEFCLATRDPNGLPTSGITRTATNKTSFSIFLDDAKFDATGGKDAWPADSYLNIWVCNLATYLGYATFPGGDPAIDGIVCLYDAFGDTGTVSPPFDLGRTTTHEVGHWLNLSHIWGDGGCSFDDSIADTPTSDAANFGCAIGHISCGTEDMVQNYMDYSDDACMNLFTQGQKDRMRALFEAGGARESLLISMACQAPENGPNLTREENSDNLTIDGTNVTVSTRVINNGNVAAGTTTIRYFLSIDPTFAQFVYAMGSDTVGVINPGGSHDESLSLDVSTLGIPDGDYYIAYYIDANNDVAETNETDNGFYWPDLQVTIGNGDCPNDIIRGENLNSGSYVFRAGSSLSSTDIVESGVSVTYYAGSSISFTPGTHFKPGSGILATIEDCPVNTRQTEHPTVTQFVQTPANLNVIQLKAYPNPFHTQTTIEYEIPEAGAVYLVVLDIFGKSVQVLENGALQDKGLHQLQLHSGALTAGTYVLVLQSGDVRKTMRLVVLH